MFDKLKAKGFDILMLHHAEAILDHDMPDAVTEIEAVLDSVAIPVEELVRGGGGEGQLTQRLRNELSQSYGWKKHNFEIKKIVDGVEKESISHEIDHVKYFARGTFALEIEWNNKDPFYDRDLENYKRLHADGVISIGGIITKGQSLHKALPALLAEFAKATGIKDLKDLEKYGYSPTSRQVENIRRGSVKYGFEVGWAHAFAADKFGEATTHWKKLKDRVDRGVGNPCPLVLIGIPDTVVHL